MKIPFCAPMPASHPIYRYNLISPSSIAKPSQWVTNDGGMTCPFTNHPEFERDMMRQNLHHLGTAADRSNDSWYQGLDTGAITSSSPRHLSHVRCKTPVWWIGLGAGVDRTENDSTLRDVVRFRWDYRLKKSVGFHLVVGIFGKSICSSRDFGTLECSFFFRIHICGCPLRLKKCSSELTGRKRSSE